MTVLTRDDILHADDLPVEPVEVPEWGGTVLVRGLTGTERDALEAERAGERVNLENFRARLMARCVVDEQGELLFDAADAIALGRKSASALQRVFEVAARLSGLTDADVEDLEKNSDGGQNGGSGSA